MTFNLGAAKSAAREGLADSAVTDEHLHNKQRESATDSDTVIEPGFKRVRLVDEDFPFDESQLKAVEGLVASKYGCLTGAAGTGKTTTTKKFVDSLLDSASMATVDMRGYWKEEAPPADDEDDYALDESNPIVAAVAMCAYTGRASQQIKSNFPVEWHNNIMTIHRMLGFVPEYYEEWDSEYGGYRNKMRFVPTYNEHVKLPWDVIIIDEAGMLGLELWHQLWAACKPTTRIYMIGDINQLPPIYGKSVFGFAMARWPTFELTHVHRQQGANNPIVDNAWRVIHGIKPETEGAFKMLEIPVDSLKASSHVRGVARKLSQLGAYLPNRDVIITPIHGINPGTGSSLGDYPLNEQLSMMFNNDETHPRYVIDGGRERKLFAVGDKVMATKNDWESGITNGMTGIIVDIIENPDYNGKRVHYGRLDEVNARFKQQASAMPEDVDFDDLDNLAADIDSKREGRKADKERPDRGPSSHTVIIEFGDGDAAFQKPFGSISEVGTLQLAYAVTCHKMQGGECPTVIIICHESHSRSLNREWLYTAITRASKNCILLHTERGLRIALNRQAIAGSNLREKILAFQEIINRAGDSVIELPASDSPYPTILEQTIGSDEKSRATERRLMVTDSASSGLAQLIKKQQTKAQPEPQAGAPESTVKVEVSVKVTSFTVATPPPPPPPPPAEVDGGVLHPESRSEPEPVYYMLPEPAAQLPAPVVHKSVSTHGAVHMLHKLRDATSVKLLPAPEPVVESPPAIMPVKRPTFKIKFS